MNKARLKLIQAALLCASSDLSGFHTRPEDISDEVAATQAKQEVAYDLNLLTAAQEYMLACKELF